MRILLLIALLLAACTSDLAPEATSTIERALEAPAPDELYVGADGAMMINESCKECMLCGYSPWPPWERSCEPSMRCCPSCQWRPDGHGDCND